MAQRPVPPGIAHGHQHAEALCLMTYATDDRTLVEVIWNSRDGVTPFVVRSPDGQRDMTHVDWRRDRYAPDHRPQPGQRVFVTLSREKAAGIARARVEQWWDHPEYPMREAFESREAAVAALTDSYWHDGTAPQVVTVQADGSYEGGSQ